MIDGEGRRGCRRWLGGRRHHRDVLRTSAAPGQLWRVDVLLDSRDWITTSYCTCTSAARRSTVHVKYQPLARRARCVIHSTLSANPLPFSPATY